jgi:hypothetical protein
MTDPEARFEPTHDCLHDDNYEGCAFSCCSTGPCKCPPDTPPAERCPDPEPARAVRAWNKAHPVGTPVVYWPGFREVDGVWSNTRTPASVLGGHTAVVWVEGRGDCIALTHVQPRPIGRQDDLPPIPDVVTGAGIHGQGKCDTCSGYTSLGFRPNAPQGEVRGYLLCKCQPWDFRTDYQRGRAEGERAATERIAALLKAARELSCVASVLTCDATEAEDRFACQPCRVRRLALGIEGELPATDRSHDHAASSTNTQMRPHGNNETEETTR